SRAQVIIAVREVSGPRQDSWARHPPDPGRHEHIQGGVHSMVRRSHLVRGHRAMTVPLTQTLETRTNEVAEPAGSAQPRRGLVVEGFDDAREMYAEYLEFVGFQVEVARNGVEAVEKAQGAPPDIILMDLSLPVMDGWEATRRLKQDLRTRDIPVMALSGHVLA